MMSGFENFTNAIGGDFRRSNLMKNVAIVGIILMVLCCIGLLFGYLDSRKNKLENERYLDMVFDIQELSEDEMIARLTAEFKRTKHPVFKVKIGTELIDILSKKDTEKAKDIVQEVLLVHNLPRYIMESLAIRVLDMKMNHEGKDLLQSDKKIKKHLNGKIFKYVFDEMRIIFAALSNDKSALEKEIAALSLDKDVPVNFLERAEAIKDAIDNVK